MKSHGKTESRRRCCECRRWYKPAPSVAKTQKTCGRACRLARRAKQEKKRREADVGYARQFERARQRRHRERQAAKAGAGVPMSRAGLSAETFEMIEEILKKLGKEQRLSRAGLGRRLRRLAQGESAFSSPEVET